ncbi:GNAT family N-acetyltransferase [Paenibacillus sp. Marseille-Q7038]
MLRTKRCSLSEVQDSDYESIRQLWMDEQIRLYLGGAIKEECILRNKFSGLIEKSKKDESFYFVVKLIDTESFIGLVSLDKYHDGENIEISYELLPAYWGRGLATEIIIRVIEYAFDNLALKRLVAETQTANLRSCTLLERVGMKLIKKTNRFGAEQAVYYLQKTRK